jgi:hypothetical protein
MVQKHKTSMGHNFFIIINVTLHLLYMLFINLSIFQYRIIFFCFDLFFYEFSYNQCLELESLSFNLAILVYEISNVIGYNSYLTNYGQKKVHK